MRKTFFLSVLALSAILTGCCCQNKCDVNAAAETKKEIQAPLPLDLAKVTLVGKTDKSPLSYKVGEKMIFTFKADFAGASSEGYFITYDRKGDDGKTFSGKVPANETLVLETSIDRPGFVNINARLVDAKGKAVKNTPKSQYPIVFYAGAAAEPMKIEACEEPADFDEFWAKQRKKLDAVPFLNKVEIKEFKKLDNNIIVYLVKIPCAGPRPVTGYLGIPADAKNKSLPAFVQFHGYGFGPVRFNKAFMQANRITLDINAHGMELEQPADYYKNYFVSIRSNGHNYAFDPIQNSDPETAYFNGMALRVMRALDYIKSRPEWDGKNLTAAGGSQGGLQSMWAGALDPDVNAVNSSITWCCDLGGNALKGRAQGTWRIKYTPALGYYDAVFMAKRIKHAKFVFPRAGLGDYVCPPSGLLLAYKNLATPDKTINWCQGSDHGFIPKNAETVKWSTSDQEK